MINGIVNIYKEKGYTSHDVVAVLRKVVGQKKIGHTGTLDPDATGVLPVCLGRATKVCELLTDHDKTYEALLLLGKTTDTQDISGEVLEERNPGNLTEEEVRSCIESFIGEYDQIPPMYSALKVNGKKLYELAREGKTVERKSRKVQIHGIRILEMNLPHVRMEVDCSKGTYIRTLCHDIGLRLGCPAHMRMLIRERTGPFCIDEAITMEEFEACVQNGTETGPWLLSMEKTIAHLPQLNLRDDLWKPCVNGMAISPAEAPGAREMEEGSVAALRCRDILIGLYEKRGGMLCLKTMLIDRENIVS